MPESPVFVRTEYQNETNVFIMYSTSSVILEKEVKAFSFGSFVADVGGVLGLFIGFSFISLLELAIECVKKVYFKCGKYKD